MRTGRLHAEVAVGEILPELAYNVTTTTVVLGALASRDWRPMHHDRDFAVNHNGTPDIFLNTPNQAAWFERYVTDWTGPTGRLGKMTFRMNAPVCAGNQMVLNGTVVHTEIDETDCGWVNLELSLTVDGRTASTCAIRIALPVDAADNPWRRQGKSWKP